MAALPYMQLYVADYLADTAHLSTVEHGAYLLLIFNYWQRGEHFSAKDEQTLNKRLATVARMSNKEWLNVSETLSEFFNVSETEWRHDRIDRDLLDVMSKSSKASEAGKASANKRAKKHTDVPTNVERTLNNADTDVPTNVERTLNNADTDVPTNVERTLNHTDTYTDTNTDITLDKSKVRAHFKKPTKKEIHDLCEKEKISIDADVFLDHYNSNGWMIGKNKMKDWESTVRNWARRDLASKKTDKSSKTKYPTMDEIDSWGDYEPNKSEIESLKILNGERVYE